MERVAEPGNANLLSPQPNLMLFDHTRPCMFAQFHPDSGILQ
jgi:hypothetical protein